MAGKVRHAGRAADKAGAEQQAGRPGRDRDQAEHGDGGLQPSALARKPGRIRLVHR